jgi:phosphatidylglycerophosphate synthase
MSIRTIPLPSPSLELKREAHAVFARSFGLALGATILLVLGGAVRILPGIAGLMLFGGLLVGLGHRLADHHPFSRLGAANRITLVRAAVACLMASRALDFAPLGAADRWMLAAAAGAALLLDGTDGWAARRQGLASAFGARFDMEIDAFAIAVLAVVVAEAAAAPCWVLAIGAMRYLYLALGCAVPLLRCAPPPAAFADRRRKAIAVVQSVALLAALAPATPMAWAAGVCAAALGLLAYSFAADMVMQLSAGPHRRTAHKVLALSSALPMMDRGKEKRRARDDELCAGAGRPCGSAAEPRRGDHCASPRGPGADPR